MAAPDDHFIARPDSGWDGASARCIVSAGRRPDVRRGIIAPAGIEEADTIKASPDNHLTSGPHSGMTIPCAGSAHIANGSPIINVRGAEGGLNLRELILEACRRNIPSHFNSGPIPPFIKRRFHPHDTRHFYPLAAL